MLPLPVLGALNLHSTKLTAYNVTYTFGNHRHDRATGENYSISGSMQPADSQTLQILSEGTRNEGVKNLFTPRTLSFLGVSEAGPNTAVNGVNTFIRYRGEIWRVMGEADWIEAGRFNVYICRKVLEHS